MNFTAFCASMLKVCKIGQRKGHATRGLEATMDHTDMRGLITAIHWSVAGLPRSKAGDHHADATHS
jgi:hypothetical protein